MRRILKRIWLKNFSTIYKLEFLNSVAIIGNYIRKQFVMDPANILSVLSAIKCSDYKIQL